MILPWSGACSIHCRVIWTLERQLHGLLRVVDTRHPMAFRYDVAKKFCDLYSCCRRQGSAASFWRILASCAKPASPSPQHIFCRMIQIVLAGVVQSIDANMADVEDMHAYHKANAVNNTPAELIFARSVLRQARTNHTSHQPTTGKRRGGIQGLNARL